VFATDEALRLVVEGVPFRDAYRRVAASLNSLQAADPRASIAQRTHAGAPGNLRLDLADEAIRQLKEFAQQRRDRLTRVDGALFGREKTG
jgi:argininosuccinate lyase